MVVPSATAHTAANRTEASLRAAARSTTPTPPPTPPVPLQVVGYITIAFPLGLLSRLFLGSRSHWQALAVPPAAALPKLLVTGSQDQFTSLGTYTDVVQQLRGQGQQQQQGQGQGQQGQQGQKQQQGSAGMDVKVMDGCDHFFVGRAKEVGDWVVHWVGQQEQGRAG